MFFKIGVLKNFAIFRGRHLCWSLFLIKLQACNFPVNTAKSFKNSFLHKARKVAALKKFLNFPGKHQRNRFIFLINTTESDSMLKSDSQLLKKIALFASLKAL